MLDDYKLEYEDMNPTLKLSTRKGGKVNKMTKNNTTPEVKQSKKYTKTRGEHFKDLVIVALVVTIIAFIGGMQFQKSHDSEVRNAMAQAQTVATDTQAKK